MSRHHTDISMMNYTEIEADFKAQVVKLTNQLKAEDNTVIRQLLFRKLQDVLQERKRFHKRSGSNFHFEYRP